MQSNQALKWGVVARNVATLVDPPRSRRPLAQPFDPELARTFIAAIHGDRLEALYLVALALGLRQGEVLGLRRANLDLSARALTVRYAMQRIDGKRTFIEPTTTRGHRTLAIPAMIVAALEKRRVRQGEDWCLAGSWWQA